MNLQTPNELASPFTYTINGFDVTHYIVDKQPLPITLRAFELKATLKKGWKGAVKASTLDPRSQLQLGV